jgi:hypothetical protein
MISELLHRLIEATPAPPSGLEIDELLAAFEAIIARRAELIERLAPPLQLTEIDRPLVVEHERRDAAWKSALTTALEVVGHQRHGSDQLRAYAPGI